MNYDARIDAVADGPEPEPFNPLDDLDGGERRARRRTYIMGAIAALVVIGLWLLVHRNDPPTEATARAGGQAPAVTVLAPAR
jgi:hypothetical protein